MTSTTAISPLLNALDRASVLALEENAPTPRGTPTIDGTIAYIDDAAGQLHAVRGWLKTHPELLRLLDQGIRDEVRRSERRITLTNIVTNLGFTVGGTIFGLYLPLILAALGR